jgi:hypothetical protein
MNGQLEEWGSSHLQSTDACFMTHCFPWLAPSLRSILPTCGWSLV